VYGIGAYLTKPEFKRREVVGVTVVEIAAVEVALSVVSTTTCDGGMLLLVPFEQHALNRTMHQSRFVDIGITWNNQTD